METASWRSLVDGILVAWQPGEEGGNAVADVLTGKANPSGHLTMTWPIAATDVPSTANFPSQPDYYGLTDALYDHRVKGVNYTDHDEDIYVGYRYFDTFNKPVAYPFGYGLSYTTFSMSGFSAKADKQGVTVKVTVKNTGSRAGKQVAQVYVAAPKGGEEKPVKELKTFAKTRMLKPGESQTLTMSVPRRLLTSFDEGRARPVTTPSWWATTWSISSARPPSSWEPTPRRFPRPSSRRSSSICSERNNGLTPRTPQSPCTPLLCEGYGGGLSFRQPVN